MIKTVEDVFQNLYGTICWKVDWDINLNLSMEFGQPSLRIVWEPHESRATDNGIRELSTYRLVATHGEWSLWVLNAYWKLTIRNREPVTGTSSYKQMRMAFSRLEGQKLVQMTINSQTAATSLTFDLGGKLEIRRYGPNYEGDVWSLYTPDKMVLSVRGDGYYSYELGNLKEDLLQWRQMPDRDNAA